MKTFSNVLLTLVLAITAFASTNAFRTDQIRTELEAMYAKIDKAVTEKDSDTLASFLSADYQQHDGTKTITRGEAIAQLKKNFDFVKSVESAKTAIDKIEQVKGKQIIDFTMTARITVIGQDGKENQVVIINRGRDWWVKGDDGKWLCTAAERSE